MAGFDRDYPFDAERLDQGRAGAHGDRARRGDDRSGGGGSHPEIILFRILAPIIGAFGRHGRLRLNYRDLAEANFGDGDGPQYQVGLDSLSPLFRILRNPDLGCGESYIDGGWNVERGDLAGLLNIFCRNHAAMKHSVRGRIIRAAIKPFGRSRANDPDKSRNNAAHHYDIGNDLYAAFLDEGMNYSCAFFETPDQSLRDAQLNKLRTTTRRLGIEADMRVLDIGCGWGELTRTIVDETEAAAVMGITLAENQLALARERAGDRLRRTLDYQLVDYRLHADRAPGTYDRVVSVGMFEHVGPKNFTAYFRAVRKLMKDDGRALVHSIMRPTRANTSAWILKYIFPGGYIPTLEDTIVAARQAGLELAHEPFIHDSFHYAETLRRWRHNFNEAWPALNRRHYDERFRRMWEFYLCGSKAAFDVNGMYVGQVLLRKA